DGTPIFDHFTVTFDRPIDPTSFTPDQVGIVYRDVMTPGQNVGAPITGITVTPVDNTDTTFLIQFPGQTTVGTYSYTIGPDIRDLVRTPAGPGHLMDQNQDAVGGQTPADGSTGFPGDLFSAPSPTTNSRFFNFGTGLQFFGPPYDQDTQPIILPGPHVTNTS